VTLFCQALLILWGYVQPRGTSQDHPAFLISCFVFLGEDRKDADDYKRQPDENPAFEHGVGEVICQPVEYLHNSIIAII
jgi:hypothetical protein